MASATTETAMQLKRRETVAEADMRSEEFYGY
jgi:hypothetical protein